MRNQLALGAAALLLGWGLREHSTMLLASREPWRLVHTLGISLTAIGGFAVIASLARWIAYARGESTMLEGEAESEDSDGDQGRQEPSRPSLRVRRHRRQRQRAEYLARLEQQGDDPA